MGKSRAGTGPHRSTRGPRVPSFNHELLDQLMKEKRMSSEAMRQLLVTEYQFIFKTSYAIDLIRTGKTRCPKIKFANAAAEILGTTYQELTNQHVPMDTISPNDVSAIDSDTDLPEIVELIRVRLSTIEDDYSRLDAEKARLKDALKALS